MKYLVIALIACSIVSCKKEATQPVNRVPDEEYEVQVVAVDIDFLQTRSAIIPFTMKSR